MKIKNWHVSNSEQEAFRKELEIASDVQQFLFPERLPYTPRVKMEASYLPYYLVGDDDDLIYR
ncbi:MAG: hypothetical protein U5K54_03820 [Cytophagales bacterium]|nr:hypothetical protein [Cytophagales bacterium]